MEQKKISTFVDIMRDPENLVRRAEMLEASVGIESPTAFSENLGTKEAIKWYHARRIATHMIWDVYAAAAIVHYRSLGNSAPALLKEKRFIGDILPPQYTNPLEDAYFKCEKTEWKDVRPFGYSYDPSIDEERVKTYSQLTIHRLMSPHIRDLLTEILTFLSPVIERGLGYHWAVGAVRLYEARPNTVGGYHSDGFPLSIKKIMIYPSGAGLEQGSTEIALADEDHHVIAGGKGVWCLFDNTLCEHRALGPRASQPRPTIEISVIPAFKNDPVVKNDGILVGYPWLPPDMEKLTDASCPEGFTFQEIKQRLMQHMVLLAHYLPDRLQI